MHKDRVRKKVKVNCSKGYLDVQKEKLSKWKESYMLDKTVWETLPSPSVEVFKSSPNCCWAWEKYSSVSPSPGFCVCSCLRCPCLCPGSAACWLCPGRDGQERQALWQAACWLVLLGFAREISFAGLVKRLRWLGAVSHGRTLPVGAAGAHLCLTLLHGGRAAVTEHLHHLAVAHGFEDFFVSGVKHFKE